jgi:NADPH-dependent ferric siderophore reductase
MSDRPAARRIERIRHEPRRRDVEVVRASRLGLSFISVTFKGEDLVDFASDSFGDHVKFFVEDSAGELIGRDYTPRRFDKMTHELTIEFVLHGDGHTCAWSRDAKPGSRAVVGGPKSSLVIPSDYAWHLLVGDPTALPAIHRRLEELPAGAQAIAVLQVASPQDERAFDSAARVEVHWLSPDQDFAEFVQSLDLPASDGFAWCAGEAASMRRVREVLVAKGLPSEAMRVAAYWKKGTGNFHETLGA